MFSSVSSKLKFVALPTVWHPTLCAAPKIFELLQFAAAPLFLGRCFQLLRQVPKMVALSWLLTPRAVEQTEPRTAWWAVELVVAREMLMLQGNLWRSNHCRRSALRF